MGCLPCLYPVFLKFRKELSASLTYIVAAVYGVRTRWDSDLRLTITCADSAKEDVERTIRYYLKDGVVLRFNRVGFETKHYGSAGGRGTAKQRLTPGYQAAVNLRNAYPTLGYLLTRPSGMAEFKLNKKL